MDSDIFRYVSNITCNNKQNCYSLLFNNLKLYSFTSNVTLISENIAIHSVNQPGITNSNATNLITNEKVIFCFIIVKALRLKLMVYGNCLKSSDIKAISAVSSAVSVPTPPIATPTVEAEDRKSTRLNS